MMADINVVPYIDVMLVLVVILMVSAPFVNPSLVQLPSLGKANRAPDRPIEVAVKADGSLLLRDRTAGGYAAPRPVQLDEFVALVRQRQQTDPNVPVVISGDKRVRYDAIIHVMDALYKADVKRVGLSVRPTR